MRHWEQVVVDDDDDDDDMNVWSRTQYYYHKDTKCW